jgi:tetratricopeptide (TPR) repeat protein
LGNPITFTTPIDPQGLPELERDVEQKLPTAFPGHLPRDDVSVQDYAAFFAIQQRFDEGEAATGSELTRLAGIVAKSPGFQEARLLQAEILIAACQQNQNETDLNRASHLIQQAAKLAPDDPRPVQIEFKLALLEQRPDEAKRLADHLRNLAPGNPQLPALRASLAEKQPDALTAWKKATEYEPSWRNLLKFARIEEDLGLAENARKHLRQILAESPGNAYALRRLAELALDYGDPSEARKSYQNLIKDSPASLSYSDYTGLGTARVLLRNPDYTGAIRAFREALRLKPGDDEATLNLADAELAQGYSKRAQDHYLAVCAATVKLAIKAQCLSHLGRLPEAKAAIQKALQDNPDNPDVIRSAALVYTLAGDTGRSLKAIEEARAKGVGPNWFKFPSFKPLFADPKFKELMNGKGRRASER